MDLLIVWQHSRCFLTAVTFSVVQNKYSALFLDLHWAHRPARRMLSALPDWEIRHRDMSDRQVSTEQSWLVEGLCEMMSVSEERRWPYSFKGIEVLGLGCGSAWLCHCPLENVCIWHRGWPIKGKAVSLGAQLLFLNTCGKLKDLPWLWRERSLEETSGTVTIDGRMVADGRVQTVAYGTKQRAK